MALAIAAHPCGDRLLELQAREFLAILSIKLEQHALAAGQDNTCALHRSLQRRGDFPQPHGPYLADRQAPRNSRKRRRLRLAGTAGAGRQQSDQTQGPACGRVFQPGVAAHWRTSVPAEATAMPKAPSLACTTRRYSCSSARPLRACW